MIQSIKRIGLQLMRKVEKITLTNYEQNGQSMLVRVSEFSLETKLIRVSKTFESKKSSEIKQVQELIRDSGLENKTFTLDALGPQ